MHYSSVRVEEFTPRPFPTGRLPQFIALGRLVPKKGFSNLVRATHRLRSRYAFTLAIHGEGPEKDNLAQLIEELGVESYVQLHGRYDNSEVPKLLENGIALIVPSVRASNGDMDGVPTVIYEAFAVGRPVVASRLSGIPEVVKNGINGVLVEPDDTKALEAAMASLLQKPELAMSLGAEARKQVVELYSHHASARALIDEWKRRIER